MKRIRKAVQVLVAIVVVSGFAFFLLAALTKHPSRRGGVILLKTR